MKTPPLPRWLGFGVLALSLPLAAAAQEAYTRGTLNLRAGPSTDYPIVARLAPGQPLEVLGCVDGYAWCDVVLPDGLRGWVYGASLDYPYAGNTVPLTNYGALIGVPIVSFALGNYWSDHYRDRPWYGERRWWGGMRPPPPMPGWRPSPPPRPGWHPRPPRPDFRPPVRPPHPGPGYRPPNRPPMHADPRPGVRPPRPPVHPGPGMHPRPDRPPPGMHRPMPLPQPMPMPQGRARTVPSPGQNTPPGDRP